MRTRSGRNGVAAVAAGLAVVLAAGSLAAADAPPWRPRHRRASISAERMGTQFAPTEWPAEPASPAARTVDAARFGSALRELCQGGPPDRMRQYADWILAAATEFDEDPFLIGALVWREGRCHSNTEDE